MKKTSVIDTVFYRRKHDYFNLLEEEHIKQPLTPFEERKRDYWAVKNLNGSIYAHMFDLLITNIEYAQREGYYLA